MSDKQVRIPKYARAGVAFAGVEIEDTFILLGGVLVGFVSGAFLNLGIKAFIGIPVLAYLLNAWYLDWKEDAPPGHLRAVLYRLGIVGYSKAYPKANMIYVGDNNALNPASRALIAKRLQETSAPGEE